MPRGKRSVEELHNELRNLETSSNKATYAELLHELQVYQEELAAQNEALREAQSELEEVRDLFIELYDFAPNGYLTLDEHGVILRINLTGASWLGKSKRALEGMPLLGFIHTPDRVTFTAFLRQCRHHREGQPLCVDMRLRNGEDTRYVQLLCRPRAKTLHRGREFFTAMVDMTERRRLEADREKALQERAALAGRIISVQEEERQRIARDLHDNIGQQVTALRLKLDAVEIVAEDRAALHDRLADAQALAQTLDRSLDYIASELRPAALDLGLPTALEQFAGEWSRTFGIPATVRISPGAAVRLQADVETHLYRIAQEALHNVYKHARARSAVVMLEHVGQRFRLTVEDDGIGSQAVEASDRHRRGLGLVSMRERAQLTGGTIDIMKASSGGTKVVVEVPNEAVRKLLPPPGTRPPT